MIWRNVSNISIQALCSSLIKEGIYTLTENENDYFLRYFNCNYSTPLFVLSHGEDSEPYLMRLIQDSETGDTYLVDDTNEETASGNYLFPVETKILILEHKAPKLKKISLPSNEGKQ